MSRTLSIVALLACHVAVPACATRAEAGALDVPIGRGTMVVIEPLPFVEAVRAVPFDRDVTVIRYDGRVRLASAAPAAPKPKGDATRVASDASPEGPVAVGSSPPDGAQTINGRPATLTDMSDSKPVIR